MHGRGIWRLTRALTLAVAVAFTTASVGPVLVGDVSTVLAENKRDKEDKSKKEERAERDKKNLGHDRDEHHVLRGQVLEIDTLKDPPQLLLATTDGSSVVKVLKTDEIAINGVRLGDHIELNGEKIHELLFEATEISVAERYAGVELKENDDKKKDKD